MVIHTDVLIVGAGPTGLALATALRRAGITPIVVERLDAGHNTSRAAVIHAHTLDVLERIGAAERLVESGLQLTTFSIRDRDRALVRLQFDDLPSKHAFMLMIPQDDTERILYQGLVAAGGKVWWGCELTALTRTSTGARAIVQSAIGETTIHARYVVGADGMRSIVRQAAGIGFSGESYEESFVLADVEMQWQPGHREVMIFFSPRGLVVVAPLPGADRYRIVATLDPAPDQVAVEHIQSVLDERGPTAAAGVTRVLWSSRFRIHHRVADHYRDGPFLLVGDAAHVHSPAGGQGMNTGLVDACVLGEMLAAVVAGRQPDGYLDRYEQRRRPAAMSVLALASRLTGLAVVKNPVRRAVRNFALRSVGWWPVPSRKLKMNLSGLSRQAAADLP